MSVLVRPGAKIYYDVIGPKDSSRPPITLINGHTRSSGDFRGMTRWLETRGIQSIIIDNRASGRSEVDRAFTLEEMEDDVVAVWKALGIKKTTILGISMGGFICLGLVSRFPEYVSKLILVSTANDSKWIKPSGGGWLEEPGMIEEKLASYFARGFVERNQLLFDTMVKQTRAAIATGNFSERSSMQRTAVNESSVFKDLASIQVPTLIVHGSEDQVIDVAAARHLESEIANSQLKLIEGVGHLILAEAPKVLYSAIENFL